MIKTSIAKKYFGDMKVVRKMYEDMYLLDTVFDSKMFQE